MALTDLLACRRPPRELTIFPGCCCVINVMTFRSRGSFTGRRWHWSGWSGRRAVHVCRGLLALCRAQLLSHCCHAQDTEEAAASIARGGTLSELRAAVTTAAAASRRRPLLS